MLPKRCGTALIGMPFFRLRTVGQDCPRPAIAPPIAPPIAPVTSPTVRPRNHPRPRTAVEQPTCETAAEQPDQHSGHQTAGAAADSASQRTEAGELPRMQQHTNDAGVADQMLARQNPPDRWHRPPAPCPAHRGLHRLRDAAPNTQTNCPQRPDRPETE